jgi:hypothetical protein
MIARHSKTVIKLAQGLSLRTLGTEAAVVKGAFAGVAGACPGERLMSPRSDAILSWEHLLGACGATGAATALAGLLSTCHAPLAVVPSAVALSLAGGPSSPVVDSTWSAGSCTRLAATSLAEGTAAASLEAGTAAASLEASIGAARLGKISEFFLPQISQHQWGDSAASCRRWAGVVSMEPNEVCNSIMQDCVCVLEEWNSIR